MQQFLPSTVLWSGVCSYPVEMHSQGQSVWPDLLSSQVQPQAVSTSEPGFVISNEMDYLKWQCAVHQRRGIPCYSDSIVSNDLDILFSSCGAKMMWVNGSGNMYQKD